MKNKKYTCSVIVCLLISLLSFNLAAIEVGKTAPELKVAKWFKNKPEKYLKAKEEGKDDYTLVLCFWATWSDTTDNMFRFLNSEVDIFGKENVVFVAMSKENQRIIDRYVRNDNNIKFAVAADKKSETYDEYMENTSGVPMFFIIDKDDELLWKGSPFEADRVLSRVITGTFDIEKEAKIEKIRKQLQDSIQYLNFEQQGEYAERILKIDPLDVTAINIIVDNYLRDNKTKEALDYMVSKIHEANYNKFVARKLYFNLLGLFQGMETEQARTYLQKATESFYSAYQNDPEALNSFSVAVVQGMPMNIVPVKDIYKLVTRAIEVQKEINPENYADLGIYNRSLAKVYYLAGLLDKAVDTQEKSLEQLKKCDDKQMIPQAETLLNYYKSIVEVNKELK